VRSTFSWFPLRPRQPGVPLARCDPSVAYRRSVRQGASEVGQGGPEPAPRAQQADGERGAGGGGGSGGRDGTSRWRLGGQAERGQDYVGRSDPEFLTHRDDFIRLGHRYVERQWWGREHQYMYWMSQAPLAAGAIYVPLPATYRHSAQLTVNAYPAEGGWPPIQLERVPIEAMTVQAPWRVADGTTIDAFDHVTPGEPRVYAVFGRELQVRPSPAVAKRIAITATGWAQELWFDSDETVLSQAAPQAVLYAALRETWAFFGDPVQKAAWDAEATAAIDAWRRDGTQEEAAAHGLPLVMQVPG
jgi:hypothetical protein